MKNKRYTLKKDQKNRYYIFDSESNSVLQGNIKRDSKSDAIKKVKELNNGNK